jgi:hypothetical protein
MIEFHNLPTNEVAVQQLVDQLIASGYDRPEAEVLVDKAAVIFLATIRGLDEKIKQTSSDESERTVIQSLIFNQLNRVARVTLEVNMVDEFFRVMGIKR